MTTVISAHAILRARTADHHAVVDAVFSRFDLADAESYIQFLRAHARVVGAIEAVLSAERALPPWRPRTAAIAADLAAFEHPLPHQLSIGRTLGLAEKFGLLYVVEGSRLGGQILKHRVGPNFANHYLSDTHRPGEWKAFLKQLDAAATSKGSVWLEELIGGAALGFQLFAISVDED